MFPIIGRVPEQGDDDEIEQRVLPSGADPDAMAWIRAIGLNPATIVSGLATINHTRRLVTVQQFVTGGTKGTARLLCRCDCGDHYRKQFVTVPYTTDAEKLDSLPAL